MEMLGELSEQARGVAYSYDSWAHCYDADVTDYYYYKAHDAVIRAVRELAPPDATRILDLATGTGLVLEGLKSSFERAVMTGIDISGRMLDKARAKYHLHATFHQCDIESVFWPVKNHSAHIMTCAGALSMIGNLDHLLTETRRVLKPDGMAAMSFFIRNNYSAGPAWGVTSSFKTHAREPEKMEDILGKHGFRLLRPIETFVGYGWGPFSEQHGVAAFAPM